MNENGGDLTTETQRAPRDGGLLERRLCVLCVSVVKKGVGERGGSR